MTNLSENGSGLHSVGKIRDAHGLKGEVFVVLFAKQADWIAKTKELWLAKNELQDDQTYKEKLYPFQIKKHKPHKVGMIVKLVGIDDRTQAEGLRGAQVRISEKSLISKKGETIFLREILNFEVKSTTGSLGRVTGFSSNNAQDLLIVSNESQTLEVPLIPEFLKQIDWDHKEILMELPEGLIPL